MPCAQPLPRRCATGMIAAASLCLPTAKGVWAFSGSSPPLQARPSLLRETSPIRCGSTGLFGSLRDLIEPSHADEPPSSSGDGVRHVDTRGSESIRADRASVLNFSRSNFADAMSMARDVHDEGGLHRDRLSAYSFAERGPKSTSEGAASWDGVPNEEDQLGLHGDRLSTFSFSDKETSSRSRYAPRDSAGPDDGDTCSDGIEVDELSVDNFNSMAGINYSARKYPVQEPTVTSDEKDQLGLHGDRLSTFSFSDKEAASRSRYASGDSIDDDDLHGKCSGLDGGEGDADEPDEKKQNAEEAEKVGGADRLDLVADSFDNMAGINYSRRKSFPSRKHIGVSDEEDQLGQHGDRLSTFSLSGKEAASRSRYTLRKDAIDGGDSVDNGDNARPGAVSVRNGPANAPSSEYVVEPPSQMESKIRVVVNERVEQVADSIDPRKGSLSFMASAVFAKTRSDRMREAKGRTDPKLLHPDGMNVPRANRVGDVMSFSRSGGKMNVFQRIERSSEGIGGDGAPPDEGAEIAANVKADEDGGGVSSIDCLISFDLSSSEACISVKERGRSDVDAGREVFAAKAKWRDGPRRKGDDGWKEAVDALLSRARRAGAMEGVGSVCVSGTDTRGTRIVSERRQRTDGGWR